MTHHVIVGGGPAATNAVETLRDLEPDAQITLVCDEPAHSRMALPYWLADQIPREQTFTGDASYFERLGVDAKIGVRARGLDTGAKSLALDDGSTLGYDRLLIATGSSALGLPVPGADLDAVQPLWSLADTESALATVSGKSDPRVVLVGAGFIGFIVLNAMHKRGWNLTVVERESHVLPRMLDARAAAIVEDWLDRRGVTVHTGTSVAAFEGGNGAGTQVQLESGESLAADLVIVATGVKPNLEWLEGAGLETGAGILVDDHMRTSADGVYAAGDVAQGPVLGGNEREIHAIQPTAIDHGRVAAANMAGGDVAYPGSLSMNVLDVCGLQCASYGRWDDAAAERVTIDNPREHVFRDYAFTGDAITGAMFLGRARDLGMLTDVGMVKGLMQTATALGPWKDYLARNPFDVRRPFVATKVAAKLAGTTLLGRPSRGRGYHHQGLGEFGPTIGPAHVPFMSTRPS